MIEARTIKVLKVLLSGIGTVGVRSAEIQAATQINRAGVTCALTALRVDGLVLRHDGTQLWSITDAGREFIASGLMRIPGRSPKYCIRVNHGMYRTPTHISWKSMLNRCQNPKNNQYKNYGARGITVCREWLNFSQFLKDMGERPKGTTLGRKDNDGNYEPLNCEWQGGKEQRHNSRQRLHYMTVGDVTMCLADWCRKLGLRENKVRYRLDHGWPVEKALSTDRYNRMGRKVGT